MAKKETIKVHKDRAFSEPAIAENARAPAHEAGVVTSEPIPNPAPGEFPIVGIGASAGALPAFKSFFSGIPANTEPGMAFVLVQHLARDHKSLLAELLTKFTRMQVYEVADGMTVQANCVYVIPPNHDMALMNGTLQLLEPALPSGHRLPIDFFFRSLAQDQHEQAIGIVLTGTGGDGTLGVRAIKGEGGMIMAQDIDSAEYDGMPRNAIATGLVDYQLPPEEMFSQLKAYVSRNSRLPKTPTAKAENTLKKIFILLRNQTGHDFSQYKRNCTQRRIERRMIIHQITTVEGYLKYLQQTPEEVGLLFQELLIGVTSFFRDPEAFKALEDQVVPKLFADRPVDAPIRVWVPGCSTGEEAYSIAILLAERQELIKQSYKVQIFATDIDGKAIAAARAGIYPTSIASDVSQERLTRFFLADGSTYRINKVIRDMLVFSEHSLIKDPPFSRLDLISCRNLLIYLGSDLQKKVIPLFHYALNPEGFLFQGNSETVADFHYLFATLDRKLKLHRRKEHAHRMQKVPPKEMQTPPADQAVSLPEKTGKSASAAKSPMRELTEQALLQRGPAAVLVNKQGDILYFHGRTGTYLEPSPGDAGISNISGMAREGLRYELVTALHKAAAGKEIVHYPGLRVKTNGDFSSVDLTVQPVAPDPAIPNGFLYLVIMEASPDQPGKDPEELETSEEIDATGAKALIVRLRQELSAKEEYLQAIREKLEASNDDLRSRNEEMQSVIEELQSTNEELETSTEELQSVNEELTSINSELQTNMFDLSQANDDMDNMLGGTGIGIIFVDHKLRILRFTPTVTQIINLIPGDVGRPVAHLVSNLVGYDNLVADTETVLNTLIPKEVEVQTSGGKWYTLRIKPYRTSANVIEGAVITFMDITEIKQDREALHQANEKLRLAVVVRDAHDAITVQDLDGRIIAWNQGAVRMYGWSEAEALAMNTSNRIPEELRAEVLVDIYRLSLAQKLEPYRTKRLTKSGTLVEVWLTCTALVNEAGKMYAIMTTERSGNLNLDPMTRAVRYDEQA